MYKKQNNEASRVSAEETRRTTFNEWKNNLGNLSNYDKRLINLEEAGAGIIFDYQVVNSTKYSKSVPINTLPYAIVDSIDAKVTRVVSRDVNKFNGLSITSDKVSEKTQNSFVCSGYGTQILSSDWVAANLKPNTTYNSSCVLTKLSEPSGSGLTSDLKGIMLYNRTTTDTIEIISLYDVVAVGAKNFISGTFTTPSDLSGYRIVCYTENFE